MIADVSSYNGICPHCEQPTGFPWKKLVEEIPLTCPQCGAGKMRVDWYKPPMEVALFVAQRRYFVARSASQPVERELRQMFLLRWQYATGLIKARTTGKISMLPHVVVDKASDAATSLLSCYLKNPGFKINMSFGAYLTLQVNSVLYDYREQRVDQYENIDDLLPGERPINIEEYIYTRVLEEDQRQLECCFAEAYQ